MFCFDCGNKLEHQRSEPWVGYYNCSACRKGYRSLAHEPMGGAAVHFSMEQYVDLFPPEFKTAKGEVKDIYRRYDADVLGFTMKDIF